VAATPRVISAEYTALVKFGMTVLWFLTMLGVALEWLEHVRTHEEIPPVVLAGGVLGVGVWAWIVWTCARLNRVALTTDALLVSNFRREISVPLRDVDRVRQSLLESGIVIIDLAHDSDLGRRFRFIPKRAAKWAFQQHPIVDHLRDAVADAKKAELAALTAR